MTAPEWRDCADPDELAAAVAAGVEVLAMGRAGDFPTANQTADQFAGSLRAGITYRIPTSWSPEPPAPDDLAARARRHADGHPESRDLIEELLGAVEPAWQSLERCVDSLADVIRDHPDPGTEALGAVWEARRVLSGRATPTPPPTPPWPGAVLSGLVDEDGVPTWLAQAGQVRGEQVRGWRDMAWYRPDGHSSDTWVEVRAPRAVPAAPVTERVPVWEAVDRWMPGGRVICGWQWSTQTRDGSVTHDDGTFTPVHDAPTVEVLKDGGQ